MDPQPRRGSAGESRAPIPGGRARAGRSIAGFVLRFAAYVLGGHLLLSLAPVERAFAGPWTRADVRVAVLLAAPLIDGVTHTDTRLWAGDSTVLDCRKGCDGLTALLILSSTILAFPAAWRRRLLGVAAGAAAVFLINAGRIASLLWVAVHWPSRLDFFHVDVWQPAMMGIAFALFFLWGSFAAPRSAAAGAGRAP